MLYRDILIIDGTCSQTSSVTSFQSQHNQIENITSEAQVEMLVNTKRHVMKKN